MNRSLTNPLTWRLVRAGLLLVLAGLVLSPGAAMADPVLQWHRFEGAVESHRSYADPFRDVVLETEFTRPDGTVVAFWGFHDGGTTWRFRMMADQVGTWRYRARFSDGAGSVEGAFEVVPSSRPGMIEVHPANPIWFGRRGGGAHLVRALHVGDRFFASNWPEESRGQFLDFVQKHGYTMLSVASHYLNRRGDNRGDNWNTPDLWPLNPREFARMEGILDQCADRGIDVYPFAGFIGKNSDAPRDPADQTLFIRYTLARLGAYSNVVLNVAGPEPNLIKNVYLESREIDRLGRFIREIDPFGHPLSIHNETGDDEYKHAPWTTFGTLQGPKTLDRDALGRGLRKNLHWAKPLLAQETLWAGNINHPEYTLEDLRKNAWVILFSATNFCFADNKGNSSTGFSGSMAVSEARLEAHAVIREVWDRFSGIPFGRLRPDYSVGGGGWCLSDGGSTYFLYFDQAPAAKASLRLPEGRAFRAAWLHPRRSGEIVEPRPFANGGTLTPPPGGDDWILRLEHEATPSKP